MAYPSIVRLSNGLPAFCKGTVLTGAFERSRGLIGMKALRPDEAWVFPRCNAVHTCFMQVPIDVIFLDACNTVIDVRTVPPWRFPRSAPRTRSIVETGAGNACLRGVKTGSVLTWKP